MSGNSKAVAYAVAVDDYAATTATTGRLTVGGTASGLIESYYDEDWFKITLTAGQAYTLGVEGALSGGGTLGSSWYTPGLSLLSPDGVRLYSANSNSQTGDPLLSFVPTLSGNYFAAVSGGGSSGTYTLRASFGPIDDFASTKSTTGAIAIGGSVSAAIDWIGDADWFRVYLSKDANYQFKLNIDRSGTGTLGVGWSTPTLTIYSQDGVQLTQGYYSSYSSSSTPTLLFTPWVSGYYYLDVRDSESGLGAYTLLSAPGSAGPSYESVKLKKFSGDIRVDSLLDGGVDWNYLLPVRTTLFYTFNPNSTYGYPITDVAAFNAEEEAAAIDILGQVSRLTGITFVETSSVSAADIHFGVNVRPTTVSLSSSSLYEAPRYGGMENRLSEYSADAYIYLNNNTAIDIRNNVARGSQGYEALLREIGHALGLAVPVSTGAQALPAEQNNTNYTVMSPNQSGGYKSTFQVNDVLALQWLYGGDGLRGKTGLNSTNGPSLDGPDVTPPVVIALSPTSGALDATASTNIVFGFNEEIRKGSGTITLTDASNGAVIESFAVDSSARISFTGSMLIIDPTADLVGGKTYQLQIPPGAIKDVVGNVYPGTSNYGFTVTAPAPPTPPVVSYTVSGTLGNDVMVLASGNSYRGGSGNDTYIISASTLPGRVTAAIVDTEGTNIIQLVDALVVGASSFYGDAAQLTLSNGAVLQILGASKFSFQVGANAVAGDAAAVVSYAEFAATLGGSLPTGATPVSGSANFTVPTLYTAAGAPTPAVAGNTASVSGTLGADILVVSAGNSYLGGAGADTYIVGRHTLAGPVTASITDTEGSNIIQLVDGTVILSSSFLNDAVQLTLSTGAKLQVLGASKFSFQLGANAPGGDTAASLSYVDFGSALGVTVPAAGGQVASGTADFLVPISGSGVGQAVPQSAAWPVLSGVVDALEMVGGVPV